MKVFVRFRQKVVFPNDVVHPGDEREVEEVDAERLVRRKIAELVPVKRIVKE
jgi:hypothetical protein